MAIKIQFDDKNNATISGSSGKSYHSQVAGVPGRLEVGFNGGSVTGMTRAAGVATEFNAQLAQLDTKIAAERERLEELYEFDAKTGQRGLRKSADGTTTRAEQEAARIQSRINSLQSTRDAQHEVARFRWSEANAADVAAASQPSDAERSIAHRAERVAIAEENEARARHGLEPVTGLSIK